MQCQKDSFKWDLLGRNAIRRQVQRYPLVTRFSCSLGEIKCKYKQLPNGFGPSWRLENIRDIHFICITSSQINLQHLKLCNVLSPLVSEIPGKDHLIGAVSYSISENCSHLFPMGIPNAAVLSLGYEEAFKIHSQAF